MFRLLLTGYVYLAAMKIHISDSTKQLLETFGNFVIEKRGFINIKVWSIRH